MNKRRRLSSGQDVILIYDVDAGFIQQSATFKEYRTIKKEDVVYEIPIFEQHNSEISGLECFWILPSDIDDDRRIEQLQRELVALQLRASEIGYRRGYNIPRKIKDREIDKMAASQAKYRAELIQNLGYDPLDYSWVERELARTPVEQLWFRFQREQRGSFDDNWENTVQKFKNKYHKVVSVEEAYDMSRQWKRYLIGAWNTIASQNTNIEDWKSAARKFEKHHSEIEMRMMAWTSAHKDTFPMARVIEPVRFRHGPYFNECIERVPQLFTDPTCFFLKPDVVLEVVSYDPELRYISLDFTADIREQIKPGIPANDPCRPMRADYIIYVSPYEIDSHLEFLGSLE
ncbi:MAG: hypothetical protein ACXAC5_02935 [Promethearchaeota archaeon]|jgi:hypothetical protein